MSFKAVYSRHGGRYFEDCPTFEEAVEFLQTGRDFCKLFQICVVDPRGKIFVEQDPTFDISDDIEPVLKRLNIPFSSERGTFVLK